MFWRNKNFITTSLKFYDFLVNDINCNFVWRCNKNNIFENYKSNVKKNHLEIGPGTGYFLKNDLKIKNLTLLDINNQTLLFSKNNLSNKYSNINILNYDIFNSKLELDDIESVGLNYVLHCVPGKLENKIDKLINNLSSSNKVTFFGATVVNDNNIQSYLSNMELFLLNKYLIFNNKEDYSSNLIKYFKDNNINFNYKIIGNVLIFSFEK